MLALLTTIQSQNSAALVRPLGSLEQLFHLIDQISPAHFAVTAEIKGPTTINAWRAALDSLQSRHPLFSVCIDINEESKPFFRYVADAPIPLRVIEGRVPSHWETEIEKELALPFNAETAPLVRAVVFHDTHEAVFTLAAHHSIADGMSLAYAIKDTLRALSGQSIEPLPVLPPQEELLRLVDRTAAASGTEAPDENRSGPPAAYRKQDHSRPHIHRLALTPETTRRLRERSREEGATVHGALCAALLLAGRQLSEQWNENPVRIMSPINTRSLLKAGDEVNLLISAGTVSFECQVYAMFWEVAGQATRGLASARTVEGVSGLVAAIDQAVTPGMDPADARHFAENAFAFEMMISNLGNLAYETKYGDLTLEKVWGPAVLAGFEGEQTVGVATINESLCMIHSSYRPLNSLLKLAGQLLESACATTQPRMQRSGVSVP